MKRKRRVKSRSTNFIAHDSITERRKRRRTNNFDINETKIANSIIETSFVDEKMTIVNDDHLKSNDIFLMRSRSKILFITSFIHIVNYDETIHQKIETIINIDVDDVDSQLTLKIEKINEYESFHNEQNYAFAH